MKILALCLSLSIALFSAPLMADPLGEEDDTYVGLQVSIPLASGSRQDPATRTRFSLLLVNQEGGMREGVAFTHDSAGEQVFGYLRPSPDLEISSARLTEHLMPLWRSDEQGEISLGYTTNEDAVRFGVMMLVGAAIIVKMTEETVEEINEIDLFEDDSPTEGLEYAADVIEDAVEASSGNE